MSYKRQTARLVIERQGELRGRGKTVPCTVVDLSEAGVRVRAGSSFSVGEELHLTCRLAKNRLLECTVQVTHATSLHFGAQITNISPEHLDQLKQFIDDMIAMNYPLA